LTERLDGQVAIVIGAAQGIGAAIAQSIVSEGARVVIGDSDAEGEATGRRLGNESVAGFLLVDGGQTLPEGADFRIRPG